MSERQPHAGDVVIHRQVHSPAIYILSRLNEPLQCSFTTYDQALDHATRFAQHERLDVWFTIDEMAFDRVMQMR